jgi:hypothetical protein
MIGLQDNLAQLNQKIEEDKDSVATPTDMLLHNDR